MKMPVKLSSGLVVAPADAPDLLTYICSGMALPDGTKATQAEIDARLNTTGYIHSVNAGSGLWGFTDWRLPNIFEFEELAAMADAVNLRGDWYWCATQQSCSIVTGPAGRRSDGWAAPVHRSIALSVRLVRGIDG